MKTLIDFTNVEAREFFLKEASYFNFDLPDYFVFGELLKKISKKIKEKNLNDFFKVITRDDGKTKKIQPCDIDDVNYTLLNNKDGKYAWRPFQLIHPVIYVTLVHKITTEENWTVITERFKAFSKNKNIICNSIPFEPDTDSDLTDAAASVTNWWKEIEQKSLELSLQFEYVMHTDITDCYGAIYTHSISWAIHTKTFAKQNRGTSHIGNLIDTYVRHMTYGQTNGIPQGSVLMDFIAEMVLGYVDLKLSLKIRRAKITDYKILRYRDDYRIFSNNPQTAEEITKYLTEILIELGMRLNAQKTRVSDNVIRDSIKPDKLYWNSVKKSTKSLQGHLLLIHNLSEEHPNSGSLRKALDRFLGRIKELDTTIEHLTVLISILVDIGYKNPRTYPIICGILSKFLSMIDDDGKRDNIFRYIRDKFNKIPNTGHMKIWLQRITLKLDRETFYDETLCKKVNDDEIKIWNSTWLSYSLEKIIDKTPIIDEDIINELDPVIEYDEISLFDY